MINFSSTEMNDLEIIYEYLRVNDSLPDQVDAIVVGGAGPRLDMVERSVELFKQGISPIIVFSGFTHPDFNQNEAELMAQFAMSCGVPKTAVLCEKQASNTGQNIIFSSKLLDKYNINCEKVILVHRPFMTRRFKATAEAQWPTPQPQFFATSVKDSFEQCLARDAKIGLEERMVWSMLGDYLRIKEYAQLGYQTHQPISQVAEVAFGRLRSRGLVPKISEVMKKGKNE